jgi:hypothetical protein
MMMHCFSFDRDQTQDCNDLWFWLQQRYPDQAAMHIRWDRLLFWVPEVGSTEFLLRWGTCLEPWHGPEQYR